MRRLPASGRGTSRVLGAVRRRRRRWLARTPICSAADQATRVRSRQRDAQCAFNVTELVFHWALESASKPRIFITARADGEVMNAIKAFPASRCRPTVTSPAV